MMHEIYARTIFEPSAKKHLPFFSCFIKKETPPFEKTYFLKFDSCLSTFSSYQSIAEDLLRIRSFVVDAI
jgi:hypothetical protein